LRKKNNQRVETYKRFSSREDCINKRIVTVDEKKKKREEKEKNYNEEKKVRQIDVP